MTTPLFEFFPTETWELFEFSMTPPPVGNFSQVSALFNFEGSPKVFEPILKKKSKNLIQSYSTSSDK